MTLDEAIEVLCRTHLRDVELQDGRVDFEIMMGASPFHYDERYYVQAWQTLFEHRQSKRRLG